MDWLLLICAGLLLFLIRDAVLLASCRFRSRTAWTCYTGVQLAAFGALGLAAESMSRDEAYALLRAPRMWIPAVLFHAVWWWLTLRIAPVGRVAAFIPTPVFLFSAGGAVWLVLTQWPWPAGWIAGAVTGVAWTLGVTGAAAPRLNILAAAGARNFAATANLSAILLIPIQQQAGDTSGVAEQPVDWIATGLPLALTAALVTLSFLLHRFRSARKAA